MKDILIANDKIDIQKDYIAIHFGKERKVLSTGPWNGGITRNLKTVFNLGAIKKDGQIIAYGDTYKEHMMAVSSKLIGIDPKYSTGLLTGADMCNYACASMNYEDIKVGVLVTGGIEKNGGRIGEDTYWNENDGVWYPTEKIDENAKLEPGTINIFLFIDANLTDGAMERALVTCSEAKTVAIQELAIGSCYSTGLATGSGTDGTIIVSNPSAPRILTEAGKHCKLGELIGKTVVPAVKEALYRQTGVDAKMQHDALRRLKRFGITKELIWQTYRESDYQTFYKEIEDWSKSQDALLWSIMQAHLLDQWSWGLISKKERVAAENRLLASYTNDKFLEAISSIIKKIDFSFITD